MPNLKRYGAIALGVVALTALGIWGVCAIRSKLAIRRVEALLQKGYGALAAEEIDKYRFSVISYDKGCQMMLGAYYSARRLERLEWGAEACLESGHESPEVYLALAAHREFTGRDNDALRILTGVMQKFDKIPDIYYRIAQILQKNKNMDGASQYILKAVERAPGANQMVVDALEFFSGRQNWAQARAMAERLKSAPTEDPELKAMIARALKNGGDPSGAQPVIDQLKAMLLTKPEYKPAIEKRYPDLFSPSAASSSAQSQTTPPPQASPPVKAPQKAAAKPAPAAKAKVFPKNKKGK